MTDVIPSQRPRCSRICLLIVLTILSLLYLGRGLHYAVQTPEPPNDLRLRWIEERYFLAGRDPNDAYFASPKGAANYHPLWTRRDESPLPEFGPPLTGGYPPWAFSIGLLFFGPSSFTVVRWWFAALNLLALAGVFLLGYKVARPRGLSEAWLLGLAGTAMSAISTTLGVGQYGLIVTGLLVLCFWSLPRPMAGVWLGLAAAKPILSGPFGLPFLLPLRGRALAALAGVFLLANAFAWWQTGAPPIEMLLQMIHLGQTVITNSYGPMNTLNQLGVPIVAAEWIAALGSVAAAAWLMARWSGAPLLVHFAIAAVAARFWSYHQLYDNLVLVFLLVALGDLASRWPSRARGAAFLAVGLSLWAPGKWCDHVPFQVYQMCAWAGGLAILLAGTPRQASDEAPIAARRDDC